MRPNELEQTEAMLRLWGEARVLDEGHGAYRSRAACQGEVIDCARQSGAAPMLAAPDQIRRCAEAVEQAMADLAPILRRLLRLRYRLGLSDSVCRQDVRFKGMSRDEFRLLRINALELVAARLR